MPAQPQLDGFEPALASAQRCGRHQCGRAGFHAGHQALPAIAVEIGDQLAHGGRLQAAKTFGQGGVHAAQTAVRIGEEGAHGGVLEQIEPGTRHAVPCLLHGLDR